MEFITIKVTKDVGDQNAENLGEHAKINREEKIEEMTIHRVTHAHTHKDDDFHAEDLPDKPCQKYGKIGFLLLIWLFMTGTQNNILMNFYQISMRLFITVMLTCTPEKKIQHKQFSIPTFKTKHYTLPCLPLSPRVLLSFEGGFINEKFTNRTPRYISVYLQSESNNSEFSSNNYVKNLTDVWNIPVAEPTHFDTTNALKKLHVFNLGQYIYI